MQTDPVDQVLSRLRNVKATGEGKWLASSPTRRDANPSLSIRRAEDGRCLLKDFGGSTAEEVVAALGMTMGDLFADDAKARTWQMSTATAPQKKRVYKHPEPKGVEGIGEGGLKWFADRCIPEEVVRRFGVYSVQSVPFGDERHGAVCFPYTKGGVRVNVKFRSVTAKKFKMFADGEPCFWGLDEVAPDAERVVLVEGEPDRLALATAGIENAITPPNGSQSLTEEVMASAAALFENDRIRFVLAGDMDEAGESMMAEFTRRVGKERCLRARWPTNCKDANDTLMQHGAEKVRECVEAASALPFEGVVRVRDLSNDLWRLYEEGLRPGHTTGIPSVDKLFTIKPGELTVLTGSPGSGKTTLVDNFIVNTGRLHGWTWGISSIENRRVERHEAGIAQKYVGKPFREGFRQRMSTEELAEAEEWMEAHVGFVKPKSPTVEEILRGMRALVYQMGITCVVIDPWNGLRHPQSMNNGDYVAEAINDLREFADRFSVHVFLTAHPTKLVRDAKGQYPVPSLYDISGSAKFYDMTDNGLSMWRDRIDPHNPPELHSQKIRFDENGELGSVKLGFDRSTGIYYDLAEPVAAIPGVEALATWRPPVPAYIGEDQDGWNEEPDQSRLAIGYAAADGDD